MENNINISLAKIVATPKESSWAQVYNAGSLFAVLSLEKKEIEEQKEDFLNLLGKDVFSTLEEEFFTLDKKDLASIKKAIQITIQKIPPDVSCSFVISSIINNFLYLFIAGSGKADIKRDNQFGTILESQETGTTTLKAASGILRPSDIVILQTQQFRNIITSPLLSSSLDNKPPEEIAEILAPLIHEEGKGGSAAIILKAQGQETADKEVLEKEIEKFDRTSLAPTARYFSIINKYLSPLARLSHSRKVFLTVAIVVFIIFVLAINFAIRKQESDKIHALFNQIYPQAEKKYNEGEGLLELNKNLARDSFVASQKILEDGKSKFPENSKEEKQILELLSKVNNELETNSPEKIAQNMDRSKIAVSVENGSGIEGAAGKVANFLKNKGYNVSSTSNADSYNYKGITIKAKKSTSAYLDLLKKDLSEKYTISDTSSDLPQDSTADILVIVGK